MQNIRYAPAIANQREELKPRRAHKIIWAAASQHVSLQLKNSSDFSFFVYHVHWKFKVHLCLLVYIDNTKYGKK